MSEGRIVEEGTAERIYDRPEHESTRELLAAAHILSSPPWA